MSFKKQIIAPSHERYMNEIWQGDVLELFKRVKDNSIDCIVTSPPYNKGSAERVIGKDDSWQKANIQYGDFKDDLPEEEYQEWQKQVLRECVRTIKSDGSIFYNHKARIKDHRIITPFEWLGDFIVRQLIIWNRKSTPTLEPIRFMPNTEFIFWITKEKRTPFFNKKSFRHGEVWGINPSKNKKHPAEIPEELVRRCIISTTKKGDLVLDPFIGSGTTGVVAKKYGRNYLGFELNEEYVIQARERIKKVIPIKENVQLSLF